MFWQVLYETKTKKTRTNSATDSAGGLCRTWTSLKCRSRSLSAESRRPSRSIIYQRADCRGAAEAGHAPLAVRWYFQKSSRADMRAKKTPNMFNCSYWTLDNNFNFNPLQRSDVAICETAFHETCWRKHEEKKISVRRSEHDLIFSDKLEKGTPQSPSTIRTLRLASQLGVQPALDNFKNSST